MNYEPRPTSRGLVFEPVKRRAAPNAIRLVSGAEPLGGRSVKPTKNSRAGVRDAPARTVHKKVSLCPVPYWRSALREKFSKNPLRDAVVLRPKKRARSPGHVVRRTPGPERTDRRFQRPALGSRRLEHGAPKRRRPQRYGRRRLRNKRHEKIALIRRSCGAELCKTACRVGGNEHVNVL